MPYADFLNAVIDDAVEECRAAYAGPARAGKRDGAIRGLGECRGLTPAGLLDLHREAEATARARMAGRAEDYWYWRLRAAQVGWVLNVVSAAEREAGREPPATPTVRGLAKASQVLGGPGLEDLAGA